MAKGISSLIEHFTTNKHNLFISVYIYMYFKIYRHFSEMHTIAANTLKMRMFLKEMVSFFLRLMREVIDPNEKWSSTAGDVINTFLDSVT